MLSQMQELVYRVQVALINPWKSGSGRPKACGPYAAVEIACMYLPVTDPAMVGSAVAAALGVGEQQGRSIDDSVLAALADRRALLVLDNCEHLSDGVAPFVERLLARCPCVSVLTTSRARLLVPFEWVYSVPPLSLEGHDGGDGDSDVGSSDAVSLFLDRAAAVGWTQEAEQLAQVAEVCRKLDGVALAIELAAARLPALGLHGLVAGLSDHLRLLVGGHRADERHRSVRAMLDWSQAPLSGADSTVLRRVSIFVSPFTGPAAAQVAGFPPLEPGEVVDGLARLADQSLLTVAASAGGTRYRALETIRQYGTEQLTETGELAATRAHHLRWCLATATGLAQDPSRATGSRRARLDAAADDLRAALGWAAEQPERHPEARDLTLSLADLAFSRNLAGEAQRRYEQAAALTDDPAAAATALRCAAGVAACRMRGDDAYHLWQAGADAAQRAGDTAAAARDLATATTTYFRMSGVFARLPPPEEATALLTRARELAGDDPAGQAAVASPSAQPRSQAGEVRRDPSRRRQRHVRPGHRAQAPRRPPHHHQGARLRRPARAEEDPPRARRPRRTARPHRRDAPSQPADHHRGDLGTPRRPALHHRRLPHPPHLRHQPTRRAAPAETGQRSGPRAGANREAGK